MKNKFLSFLIRTILIFVLIGGCDNVYIEPSNEFTPHESVNYYRLVQYDFDGQSEIHNVFQTKNNYSSSRIAGDTSITYREHFNDDFDNTCWEGNYTLNSGYMYVNANDTIRTRYFNFIDVDGIPFILHNRLFTTVVLLEDSFGEKISIYDDYTTVTNFDFSKVRVLITCTRDLRINFLRIKSTNPNFLTPDCSSGNLPITILKQSAIFTDDGVLINFITATEFNSDYVEIQWLKNNSDLSSWQIIGVLKSNNEPSTYEYLHRY